MARSPLPWFHHLNINNITSNPIDVSPIWNIYGDAAFGFFDWNFTLTEPQSSVLVFYLPISWSDPKNAHALLGTFVMFS